jgi:RimJ/RimL family protein N-acetyltransferase
MEAPGTPKIPAGRDAELKTHPTIETGRLLLRRWRDADRAPFAAVNADARVREFYPHTLSREESDRAVDRIEMHFEQRGFGLFAAELRDSGEFIGYIGLSVPSFEAAFTPCVEIGWRLAADRWGRGLATEGAGAVLQWGFESLALPEIVSFTVPGNLRSRRVMEKIGMTRDENADFDHPLIPPAHPLRNHVLYRAWRGQVLGYRPADDQPDIGRIVSSFGNAPRTCIAAVGRLQPAAVCAACYCQPRF